MKSVTFSAVFFIYILQTNAQSILEELYCGKDNCYDVLGVNRDTNKSDIAKAYRRLAKKYHPDLYREEDEKKNAETHFKIVANAYEILKDEDSRTDYDFMLDNPEQVIRHYYRYYRRRMVPKVDVRIVIVVFITICSVIQYIVAWQRYKSTIKHLLTVPKYRNKALQIANEKGLIENGKKPKGKSKSEVKEETESVIRKVIEENMDIRGAYAKPVIADILWMRIIFFPYDLVKYICWYICWVWKHNICKLPYDNEEKLYLIRKYMKKGPNQFAAIEESEKQDYLKKELWNKEKFNEWFQEKEEEQKKLLAENARYKSYRRYLKSHGPGRITFDDS